MKGANSTTCYLKKYLLLSELVSPHKYGEGLALRQSRQPRAFATNNRVRRRYRPSSSIATHADLVFDEPMCLGQKDLTMSFVIVCKILVPLEERILCNIG